MKYNADHLDQVRNTTARQQDADMWGQGKRSGAVWPIGAEIADRLREALAMDEPDFTAVDEGVTEWRRTMGEATFREARRQATEGYSIVTGEWWDNLCEGHEEASEWVESNPNRTIFGFLAVCDHPTAIVAELSMGEHCPDGWELMMSDDGTWVIHGWAQPHNLFEDDDPSSVDHYMVVPS